MKKRFLSAIALIIAFVMSFSLLACRSGKGGSNVPDGPLTVGKATSSIEALFNNSYTGSANVKLSSKANADGTTYTADFEKRGDQVKFVYDSTETIVDFATGYVYSKAADGYVAQQMLQAGAVDYYLMLYKSALKDVDLTAEANSVEGFNYDESTGTLKISVDAKTIVNALLAPIENAANSDTATLEDLIDAYIEVFVGMSGVDTAADLTLESIVDTVSALLVMNKDVTIGTLITLVEASNPDINVKETLKEIGAEYGFVITDTMYNLIRARKLGDMTVATVNYINSLDNIHDINAAELVNALLFEQASSDNLAEVLGGLKTTLFGMLRGYKVKEVVEMLNGEDNPVALKLLYAVIKNSVQFTALNAEITVVFDADFNVVKFGIVANAAHNYNKSGMNFSVLADNDYRFEAEIAVDEYTDNDTPFDINFSASATIEDELNAVVPDNAKSDVKVYYEACGKSISVTNISAVYYTEDGTVRPLYDPSESNASAVTYDATTSTFTFPIALIKSAMAKNDFTGAIYVTGDVGEDQEVVVILGVVASDLEEAAYNIGNDLVNIIFEYLPI